MRRLNSFQGLKIGNRLVDSREGWKILCSVNGELSWITIFYPEKAAEESAIKHHSIDQCWCTCCFAEGVILERSSTYHCPDQTEEESSIRSDMIKKYGKCGDYGNWGSQNTVEDFINACANDDGKLINYNGIRYLVDVCQGKDESFDGTPAMAPTKRFYCASSDYAEYHVDDIVAVWYRGSWSDTGGGVIPGECGQCKGTGCTESCSGKSYKEYDDATPEVDGVYVILPLDVTGVTRMAGTEFALI